MDVIVNGIIAIIIFGGGAFVGLYVRFWIAERIERMQRRRYARRVLNNCVSRFVEHY